MGVPILGPAVTFLSAEAYGGRHIGLGGRTREYVDTSKQETRGH